MWDQPGFPTSLRSRTKSIFEGGNKECPQGRELGGIRVNACWCMQVSVLPGSCALTPSLTLIRKRPGDTPLTSPPEDMVK